jgi:hypothetical protein
MRTVWTKCALLLAAGCLAVVAAGCGGGSGNGSTQPFSDYETQMQQLGATLGAAIATAGGKNISAGPAQIEHNLRHVQVLLRTAADRLARITPPQNVAAAHQQLIAGVREYANQLNGIIASVKSGGGRPALAGIFTLSGLKSIQRASQAIEKAGYAIVAP